MMNELKKFYAGKNVLITGHTGFKGSWLSQWLLDMGAQVTGFALPPLQADDHFNLLGLSARLRHIEGDIRDAAMVKKVCADVRPDIVFHLAAQALVRRSYQEPRLTFETNVMGSVNLLEAVRDTPSVRSLVYITSDKCYQNVEWVWGYRETDSLGGDDPYSASKACAEIVLHSYVTSFFKECPACGIAGARAGNVIGGGDWSVDRIVPDAMRSLRSGKPIVLRNPVSTRPWQHVMEPLSGYLLLGARLWEKPQSFSGSWNIGPRVDSIKTVMDLARKITAVWGGGEIVVERQLNAPHEAGLLHLNCDKAHQQLGWTPRWGFDTGVEKTVQWYKQVMDGAPAKDVTAAQIRAYMGEAQ